MLQIVFVSTPSLIYMGHAMHIVRRDEKRRSREEEGGEGGGTEDDPGGGDGGGEGEKRGRKGEKEEVKEKGLSAGRVRLRGALLQTYILSILIRTIMEVKSIIVAAFKPLSRMFWFCSTSIVWFGLSALFCLQVYQKNASTRSLNCLYHHLYTANLTLKWVYRSLGELLHMCPLWLHVICLQ